MSVATTARIIDGKTIAAALRAEVAQAARGFAGRHGKAPGLAVVLVGDDPASEVYVASKVRLTREAGMRSIEHRLPAETRESDLVDLVATLNRDPEVNGILIQLPLPRHIDARRIILTIDPMKDVDGLHPTNAGRLINGLPGLVPCTPLGSMHLVRSVHASLKGKHAVVVGRSALVGKPMAHLLIEADATVTVAHRHTSDLRSVCRSADVLVVAVGLPDLIRADFVKPGATVIDVGINRLPGERRLVGDVAFAEVAAVAGAITPVPGGVGPMTIACLLQNTLRAAELQDVRPDASEPAAPRKVHLKERHDDQP